MKLSLLLAAALTLGVLALPARTAAPVPDPGSSASQSALPEPAPGTQTGSAQTEAQTPASNESTSRTDPSSLTEPPALIVRNQYDADRVQATTFTYAWTTVLPDGMESSRIACGVQPMQMESLDAVLYTAFPAGTLPPAAEGTSPGGLAPAFTLDFGNCPPDSVTAHRWKSEDLGRSDLNGLWSEEVPVDCSDGFTLLPLGDGAFVYEISARWGNDNYCVYAFRTVPQVRPQA